MSKIFITYDDFQMYMEDHVNDFCYWIDEANLNATNLAQKMSAMFVQEITFNSTRGLEWTEWTSMNGWDERELVLILRGMIQ